MNGWAAGVFVGFAASVALSACGQVEQASNTMSKVSACAEALQLSELNPLVDREKLKARAEDKARRLRELGDSVEEQNLRKALFTMADSYVEVQQERFEDLGVVTEWAKRNTANLEVLRKACL